MKKYEYRVTGKPMGQPRARAFSRGGHARMFDPGTADAWKLLVRDAVQKAPPSEPFAGAVSVTVVFNMLRPRSHRTRKGSLAKGAPTHPVGKPDLDNLAKAVMDAVTNTGLAWRDDSQVVILEAHKLFVDEPSEQGCRLEIGGVQ